jgi:hypothetical protein
MELSANGTRARMPSGEGQGRLRTGPSSDRRGLEVWLKQ